MAAKHSLGLCLLIVVNFIFNISIYANPADYANKYIDRDIMDVLSELPELSTLKHAFELTELTQTMRGMQDITLFAPSNDAFSRIPAQELEELLANKGLLTYILEFHVSEERITAIEAKSRYHALMLNGRLTSLMVEGDYIYIDDAKLIVIDIPTSNGIIHIINNVLGK